jgi:hypothetical protein
VSKPQTDVPWLLTGDADLMLLAPLDLRTPLGESDRSPLQFHPDLLRHWAAGTPAEVVRDLRGSLTYGDAEQTQIVAVLQLLPAPRAELQAALVAALPGEVDRTCFALETCEALVLDSGAVSLRLHICVDRGWTSGDVLVALGPEHRDHVCNAVREAMIPLLSEVQEAVTASRETLDLAYFHLMYAGAAPGTAAQAGANDLLRALVYPPSAAPLSSHSPRLAEFVFLGYAFSLVVVAEGAPQRLRELSRLVGLCSVVFRRFERVCDAIDAALRDEDGTCDKQSLLRLEERVQVEYDGLLAPTFSYRHELLVMRECVLREWQVDRLAIRSRTLLALLGARVTRLDQEQTALVGRKLEMLLFAVAAMSVFSVATDALGLARAGDWLVLTLVSLLFFAVMGYAVRGLRR